MVTEPRILNVGIYDPETDTIMIEGARYSGQMFRAFGLKAIIGKTHRIERHADGVLRLTAVNLDPGKPYVNPWLDDD